jgi:hypothetical protein
LGTLKGFEFFNEMPIKVTNCAPTSPPTKIDHKIFKTSLSWGGQGTPFWLVLDSLGLASVSNDLSWALKSRSSLKVMAEKNSFNFNLVLNAPTQGQLHISKFKDLEKCKVRCFNASK